MTTFFRIKADDVQNRFRAGEIGLSLKHNFEKYDFLLDLGTQYIKLFDQTILAKRHFYFYADEIECCD